MWPPSWKIRYRPSWPHPGDTPKFPLSKKSIPDHEQCDSVDLRTSGGHLAREAGPDQLVK
jgi:hypothetical protein